MHSYKFIHDILKIYELPKNSTFHTTSHIMNKYGPTSMHINLYIFSNNLSPSLHGILYKHPLWRAPLTIEQMTSNANLFSDYPSFFLFCSQYHLSCK